ncbi:MAG: hypothetical protein F2842_04560, partial [Actinobacteria bacterium]|nr:hypothetical protein [Actinomycetota bacterium]
LDPVTWRVLSSTDPAGLTVSASTGPTLRSTTDKAGRVTTYGYDDLGQVTSVSGPVEPGAEGLRSATQRDTTRTAGGDDKPLAGLRAVVFAQPNFLGGSRSQYLPADPDRGSLSASWSGRPATFSGQAAGVWNPDDSDDAAGHADGWRFLLTASGGSDAELVVGGNLCAENVPCTVSGLPTGPKAVRVQLRRAGTSGWFQVTAAPVGRPLVVLPSTEVGPGYGLTTVAGSNDDLPGAPAAGAQTLYKYADPASSIPSSTVTPGGLATALAHEAGATGNNDWGRLTSTTTPGGRVSATAYWDDNVDATLPAPCGGGTQRQSGQVRSVTLVDGRVVQSWFDLRGQERATVITGDGLSQTYCTSYFADGAVATTGVFDTAGDLIESSATTRVSPLTTSLLVTHGPAAPVNPGTSVTTTSTVDLRGRDVSSTDAAGSTTTVEYDVLGNVTSRTTTPPAGSGSPALVVASTYRAEDGRLATVSVNGVIAATVLYDPTSGRVSRITYPNGIRTGYSWQPNGPLGSVAVVTGIADLGTVTERRTVSAFGRVESSVARTSGMLAFSEQRGYQYDAAGRLASAVISTTNGSAPAAASFAYGYGAQNAGCPTGYAGAGKDGLRTSGRVNGTAYVVCHDSLGRLSSTTSPLVTGGGDPASATHDGLGRLLTLGGARPLSLTWGVGGSVAVIDESDAGGGHSVTTTLDEYGGEILDQTVLSDAGTDTVRLSGPFRLRLTSGEVTGTASLQYGLPGGATVTLTTGSEATLSLPGVDGSALVTLPVPSLGAGTSATASIAGRFGPYGEPLADIPTDTGSALPAYTWKASARQQTMAGTSSITLLPARAYAPLVGEFLSPDPVPDAASNLYAYTDGDPVNQSDPTGGSSDDSSLTIVTGVLSAAGLFGSMWGGYAIGRYKELARFAGWGASVAGALMAGVNASLAAKSQNADNGATVAIGLAAAAGSGVASYGSYRFGVNRGRVVRNARAAQLGRDRQAQNSLKQQTKVQKFTRRGLEATERVKTEGYMGAVTNDRNVKAMVQSKYEPNVVIREEPLSTRYSSGIDGSRRGSGSVSDDLDNLSMMQGGSFVGSE